MNNNEKFVITISRELGSGGHTIARKLADKLGVRLVDKQLIKQLSAKFDLNPLTIERLKGEKKPWLSDFIRLLSPAPSAGSFIGGDKLYGKEFNPNVTTDDIFEAETEILKQFAEEGSCVIAGRSGFFVLKGCSNKVDIFITASKEKRIERTMRKQNLTHEMAEEVLEKVDKARENYIKRYANVSRYDARNYDLCINMDELTEDKAVEIILSYIGCSDVPMM
ncbi:MAG: cytidylate kinase-like family protein [Bacteroidales bacterium]|nr:cytidylate kinase-like family protein [Bacteroidales bacterium]